MWWLQRAVRSPGGSLRLCRLIFAEDLPPEEVDEHFLDLLSRARESDEGAAVPRGPRKPAPLLCGLEVTFVGHMWVSN